MDDILLRQIIEDSLILEKVLDEKKKTPFVDRYLEPLEVIDDDGRSIGTAPRGLIHRVGLRHRTVFVLVWSPDNKLLLQTRGSGAGSSQFRLDISVGGHVKAGEIDLARSAMREMKEELGLEPDKARLIFVAEYNRESPFSIDKPHERNRERRSLFEYWLLDHEMRSLDKLFSTRESKSEVATYKWFDIAEVIAAIDAGKVADGLMTNVLHSLAGAIGRSH